MSPDLYKRANVTYKKNYESSVNKGFEAYGFDKTVANFNYKSFYSNKKLIKQYKAQHSIKDIIAEIDPEFLEKDLPYRTSAFYFFLQNKSILRSQIFHDSNSQKLNTYALWPFKKQIWFRCLFKAEQVKHNLTKPIYYFNKNVTYLLSFLHPLRNM